jgi:hypothetical protein
VATAPRKGLSAEVRSTEAIDRRDVLDDCDRSGCAQEHHALAAVDAATGQLLGEREIAAREQGHLEVLRWAHGLGEDLVWAIEDCRDLSHHLEQALIAAGERVAPKLMGASPRGEREPGKSDQIDARAIARAVLREGVERFPVAFLDCDAAEIRLLCDHRDTLVSERTRLINRLRINLVVLDPELEAKIPDAQDGLPRAAAAHHSPPEGNAPDRESPNRTRAGQAHRRADT